MTEGWSFPSNNYGQISGIAEAGIETFRGTPFRSLAREICQNSLDARVSEYKPVVVEFALSQIFAADLPGFSELRSALDSCNDFWSQQRNDKTVKFFAKARKVAAKQKIAVLRISDYNTTGLTGSDKEYNTPWQNLVKAAGVSGKNGTSGGSFGIGKSAPFACSDLRTVFYATRDVNGREAFQGIARLVSFRSSNGLTTGTGYYGLVEHNKAVHECRSLCTNFYRQDVGTDVFVVGLTERREWQREVVASILDDFLLAIYEGALEVRVEDIVISRENLGMVIEEYQELAKTAYNYYQTLTNESAYHVVEDFAGLGEIEIFMLIGSALHRRVLMARGNGMKTFDQKNFPSAIHFAGICILRGDGINSYFRELENPQHDAWEPERSAHPTEAKRRKQELFRHLKELVLELGRTTPIDEEDAEGVGEYLPDEVAPVSSRETKEELSEDNKAVEVTVKPVDSGTKGFQPVQLGGKQLGTDVDDIGEIDLFGGMDQDDDNLPADPSEEQLEKPANPPKEENDTDVEDGIDDEEDMGTGTQGEKKNRMRVEIPSQSVRLILVDKVSGRYRLNFIPMATAREATLSVKIAGEQGGSPVFVKNAKILSSGVELVCKRNTIALSDIKAYSRASVEFCIVGTRVCSMEVNKHSEVFADISRYGYFASVGLSF